MQTGTQLRYLFATILLFCEPSRPEDLWATFREHVCDDLQFRLTAMGYENPSPEEAYNFGLFLLDDILQQSGHRLSDFPAMPTPQQNWAAQVGNPEVVDQLYDSARINARLLRIVTHSSMRNKDLLITRSLGLSRQR